MRSSDRALASLIIILFVAVIPLLTTRVYWQMVVARRKMAKTGEFKDIKDTRLKLAKWKSLYGFIGDGCKVGDEWYGIMSLYRRLSMAMTTVLMQDAPYWQLWSVTGVYSICLIANVWLKPFRQRRDHYAEIFGQVMTIFSCIIPIVSYHRSNQNPDEALGQTLVYANIIGIIAQLVIMVPDIIRLYKRIFGKQKTEGKPTMLDEAPVNFMNAMTLGLRNSLNKQANRHHQTSPRRPVAEAIVYVPERLPEQWELPVRELGQETVAGDVSTPPSPGACAVTVHTELDTFDPMPQELPIETTTNLSVDSEHLEVATPNETTL
jgi:hypothetical protein